MLITRRKKQMKKRYIQLYGNMRIGEGRLEKTWINLATPLLTNPRGNAKRLKSNISHRRKRQLRVRLIILKYVHTNYILK